jgi:hypothetical protein
MKVYHQAGHNAVWNINSFQGGIGDGIILSPVHQARDKVEALSPELKQQFLFDPQFYVPDSQKNKLNSYSFFPECITDGFSTLDYASIASDSAEQCVDFQIENNFEALIIPARYINEMLTDYIDRQRQFTVEPFLTAISNRGTDKDVYLTLPVTTAMISDVSYRKQLLNWITTYPEITGVYLLISIDGGAKQISDFKTLYNHALLIQDLQHADLTVICGYSNTEGVISAALDVHAITIGAYENTRRFSVDKFLDDDSIRKGPAPRIYLPKLLNWIRFDTAVEIREDEPTLWDSIYSPTIYAEKLFTEGTRPHFSQSPLYLHHFELITKQYADIEEQGSSSNRQEYVHRLISEALEHYRDIQVAEVELFDSNCSGDHLIHWNRVLKQLRKL